MRTLLVLLAFAPLASAAGISALEIVQRACDRENRNLELRRLYTYRETATERIASKSGKIRKDERTVSDVFYIGGEKVQRLVQKDGQSLTEKEAAKEQSRLDKEIEKRRKERPEVAQRRIAKEQREQREFRQQIPLAFDFTLVAEEKVAGRTCYRVHAEPKVGFKPKGDGKILTKVKGDLWVDKESYEWARVEAETVDTVSVMVGLARLAKGTTIRVRQTYVNNEVWFPDLIEMKANAKALFFMSAGIDVQFLYTDFRKFTVDSRVISSER